jgi:hypothetical protein
MFYQIFEVFKASNNIEMRKHIAFFEELENAYNYLLYSLAVSNVSLDDIKAQLFQWQEAYISDYLISQETFLD